MSDGLQDVFHNIGDGAGKGEDHCEFVGANSLASEVGDFKVCEGMSFLLLDHLTFYSCTKILESQTTEHLLQYPLFQKSCS